MYALLLEFDLLYEQVGSLKQKRSLVRPVVADIRRRWPVAVAEVDHLELLRRAGIGVAVVANSADRCQQVGDEIERFVAAAPESELLSARWRWVGPADEGCPDCPTE